MSCIKDPLRLRGSLIPEWVTGRKRGETEIESCQSASLGVLEVHSVWTEAFTTTQNSLFVWVYVSSKNSKMT